MSNFGEVLSMCGGEKQGKETELLLQLLIINIKRMRGSWQGWSDPLGSYCPGVPLCFPEHKNHLSAWNLCIHSWNKLCLNSANNTARVCAAGKTQFKAFLIPILFKKSRFVILGSVTRQGIRVFF